MSKSIANLYVRIYKQHEIWGGNGLTVCAVAWTGGGGGGGGGGAIGCAAAVAATADLEWFDGFGGDVGYGSGDALEDLRLDAAPLRRNDGAGMFLRRSFHLAE